MSAILRLNRVSLALLLTLIFSVVSVSAQKNYESRTANVNGVKIHY